MRASPDSIRLPADLWQRQAVTEALARRDLAALLAQVQRYGGISQTAIGGAVGMSQGHVSQVMGGRRVITALDVLERIADGLAMPDPARMLLGLAPTGHLPAAAVSRAALTAPATLTGPPGVAAGDVEDGPESIAEILARSQRLGRSAVDSTVLDQFDAGTAQIIDRYELDGPTVLIADAVRLRRAVDELVTQTSRPTDRDALNRQAARISALLGYMCTNLGQFPHARAYNADAFALAGYLTDTELQAWVRGTQSFCEYYAADYPLAVKYAVDGYRYADRGPQTVRLAINGHARAAGKLGDRGAVTTAVGLAYDVLGTHTPPPGFSSCISFDLYSEARVAANAATAFLNLGDTATAASHADQVIVAADASESVWSQCLTRLDKANAAVAAEDPDPELAADLGHQVLTIGGDHLIESIRRRSAELATSLTRWNTTPTVKDLTDRIAALPNPRRRRRPANRSH